MTETTTEEPARSDADLVALLVDKVRCATAVRPGDVLVFLLDGGISCQEADELGTALTRWFADHAPEIEPVIVGGPSEVYAVRAESVPG